MNDFTVFMCVLYRYVSGLPETCAYFCSRKLDTVCNQVGDDTLLVREDLVKC